VLDVGSGTGYYTRLFRRLGAAQVVGVDASAEMVKHARSVEEREPLGISYQHHDAVELPVLGNFDVITAVWLFGNIEGEAKLWEMARRLRANLAEGGVLVALVPNPDAYYESSPEYQKYGVSYTPTQFMAGRQGVRVHFLTESPVEFEGFFWPPGVVEAALRDVGFTDLQPQPTKVPEDDLAERGPQFWEALLASPHFSVLTARSER
ncbi:MAG: class I SAM-dependent methyltransferase, partial [Mycobacteriales bacterium]